LLYHLLSSPAPLSLVPSLARHRSATGPVLGPPPARLEARSRSTKSTASWSGVAPGQPPRPSRLPYCQRTRRGPADGPQRALFHPL